MSRARPFPLHAGVAEVTAVVDLTPAMRRFTLAAEAFSGPGIEQPGEIITLGWPLNGEALVLPELGWRFPEGTPAAHWRNYTVRSFAPERATLDVDFFLHGPLGHASAWAETARPGATVGFAGPRVHWEPDPEAGWTLLAADETGLPALLAIAEALPAGHRTVALAEVAGEQERQPLVSPADLELHWVSREGRAPGSTGVLLERLRALELPDGRGQAWGGGEALAMRDLRRHLQASRPGLDGSLRLLGYWKHDRTPADVY
ncbi:MAG: siderophore-interacting protein [Thermoleophilaceae bacterium]|nr:siderophore-interacting protein [Thermoleophilaceae bacterium]